MRPRTHRHRNRPGRPGDARSALDDQLSTAAPEARWHPLDLLRRTLTVGTTVATLITGTSSEAPSHLTGAGMADTPKACTFAAPTPYRNGANVTASADLSDCGPDSRWVLTIQRHRYGPIWQNEGSNQRKGDGTISLTTGCVPGLSTYRTVLDSAYGHQSIGGPAEFNC